LLAECLAKLFEQLPSKIKTNINPFFLSNFSTNFSYRLKPNSGFGLARIYHTIPN
jgi:hypothetical protein